MPRKRSPNSVGNETASANETSSKDKLESNSDQIISASECCTSLSTTLENGFLLIRKIGGEEREEGEEDDSSRDGTEKATDSFVELLSSSAKDRSSYLDAIRSTKFQKHHARRLFSALFPLLKYIFENEHYVPLSAFEDDVSCQDGDEDQNCNKSVSSKETVKVGTNKMSIGSRNKRSSEISEISDCSIEPDEASTQALLFIKYSAMIVHAFLNNQTNRQKKKETSRTSPSVARVHDMIEEVYVVAELLHSNLFSLNSCGREGIAVQKEIIAMCESYWKGQFSDREVLVTQLLPLLVVKSLNGNATRADIKRLWNMKEALHLLDFQEKSTIVELRNLLLRTVSSPLFVKNMEGRKMIAFLFQLDISLAKDLHHSIRAQIPLAKMPILKAYGEIYFLAWKEVARNIDDDEGNHNSFYNCDSDELDTSRNGSTEQKAVEDALQDLMFASLHAPTPHMAKAILTVLSPIHSQKKNPQVDNLLYRMYNPLLWRALSATNPLVRIHASTILHTTFPLHDPNAGKAHLKEVNDKSIEILISLLNDDDPKVRIAGCDAAIRILGVFWDALRSDHIRSLLNEIIMKHVNDSSSAAVRAQAVKGITLLLDAQASHGVLKPLLPLVGNHIHDSVERVRLECVRLLLKLKGIKGIKYYHVVPSQHILSRLACEGERLGKVNGPVTSAITELLLNSYFPKGAKGSDQMKRTLHFITQNPAASRAFYSNISRHLETNNTCKLIVMIFKTMKIGVEKDRRSKVESRKNTNQSDDNDGAEDEMRVSASNTNLMAGLAESMYIVWKSTWGELLDEENKECLEFIQTSISSLELVKLSAYFEDLKGKMSQSEVDAFKTDDHDRIITSLLSCAEYTSSPNVEEFCALITNRSDNGKGINMVPYYAVLCSWGMQNGVAFSLSRSIDRIFDDMNGPRRDATKCSISQSEGSHVSRSKRKQPDLLNDETEKSPIPDMQSDKFALDVMGKMLSGKDQSSTKMRESILSSEIACCAIECSLEKATLSAQRIMTGKGKHQNDSDIDIVLNACEVYSRFILHKEAFSYPIKLKSQAKDYLFWISNQVVKVLSKTKEVEEAISSSPFHDLNLSRISAIGSRASDIQPSLSPLPVSPPRRRRSLSHTDESFAGMEERGASEFVMQEDISSSVRERALCMSLIRSAMSVFGEWLLVGVQDGSEIIGYVKEWCQVMKQKSKAIDASQELFPSLCRLMVIGGKVTFEYNLLVEVLSAYESLDHTKGGFEVLTKTVESIISIRRKDETKLTTIFVRSLVDSIPLFVKSTSQEESVGIEKDEVAMNELVKVESNGWAVGIRTILNHGKSIPVLIEVLLDSLTSDTTSDSVVDLNYQLLHISCSRCAAGKVGDHVKKILNQFSKDNTIIRGGKDDEFKTLIEAIPA